MLESLDGFTSVLELSGVDPYEMLLLRVLGRPDAVDGRPFGTPGLKSRILLVSDGPNAL